MIRFIISFFGGFILFLALGGVALPENSSDAEVAAKLVAGSPWNGTWGSRSGVGGNISYKFYLEKGKLAGELISITGSPVERPGPVQWLEIKKGEITFITSGAGTNTNLHLEGEDLVGTWQGRTSNGWGKLSPSK